MRALAMVVGLAACGASAPVAVFAPPADAPRGTQWMTPQLPWHLSDGAAGVIVDGNIALVAGTTGVIEEIDLATGVRVRGHAVPHSFGASFTVSSFAKLGDGRYAIAGTTGDEITQAAILAPTTFAPTWFSLERLEPEKDTYSSAQVFELPDHSLAVVGKDLPLALYDPTTLARTKVLAETPGWSDLAATSTTLYAKKSIAQKSFDLATGKETALSTSVVAAVGDTYVIREYVKGVMHHAAYVGATKPARREFPTTLGFTAVLDPVGARIASLRANVITVYRVEDGSTIGRFDLSPVLLWGDQISFAGDKLVIAGSSTLRVADLATGSLTSVPEPYGPYLQVAVEDSGAVAIVGSEVWRIVDGALASTASVGKHKVLVAGTPLARFATRTSRPLEPGSAQGKFPSVIAVKTIEGRPVREWTLPRETDGAWIGTNNRIVASYKWGVDAPQKFVVSDGPKLRELVEYHIDAMVDDVDVDAGVIALSLGGTATLVSTTNGESIGEVYNPNCAEYGSAQFEHGGSRVLTFDEKDLLLWDRTSQELVGAARFADVVREATFIPGERDLLVRIGDNLVQWSPATNATRSTPLHANGIAISPNRRWLAVHERGGRIALVDLAMFRAGMKPGATAVKISAPKQCSHRDPLDPRDPEDYNDDQTGDIDHDSDSYEHLDGEDTGD